MNRFWPRTWRPGSEPECKAILWAVYHLGGGGRILDLGVRHGKLTRDLPGVRVDIDPQRDMPFETTKLDIREAPEHFKDERFDLAVMTDVIEHLTRDDGEKLLLGLWDIASCVYLFTPTGPLWIDAELNPDSPHGHKSGWYPEQLFERGWAVWEWPCFHRFPDGNVHGAFFAWKKPTGPYPSVEDVSEQSGVAL